MLIYLAYGKNIMLLYIDYFINIIYNKISYIMIKSFEQFNKLYEGTGQGLGHYNDKMKDYYGAIDDLLEDCIGEIKKMLIEIGGSFEFDPEADDPLTTYFEINNGAEVTEIIRVYINEERKDSVFVDYSNGESGYISDMVRYGDIIEIYIAISEYMQNKK